MESDIVHFTSLGTTVLDEIHFSSAEPVFSVIGGSAVFCILGARLFLDPPKSGALGWAIRHGDDFPSSIKKNLLRWETTLLMLLEKGKQSTASLLKYKDSTFGPKSFRFLTEVLTITPTHLVDTPLLAARIFHLMTAPILAEKHAIELKRLRKAAAITDNFLIVWEPAPLNCTPANLADCLKAAKSVDIFSPNHIELAALFDVEPATSLDRSQVEDLASRVLASGVGFSSAGTVIVRAGANGCCICSRLQPPLWLPAYYNVANPINASRVVDPTGAGNAFLGGFAIGYLETGDVIEASCFGTVSASFALEQIGPPVLEIPSAGQQTWNGVNARSRLAEYKRSLHSNHEINI